MVMGNWAIAMARGNRSGNGNGQLDLKSSICLTAPPSFSLFPALFLRHLPKISMLLPN